MKTSRDRRREFLNAVAKGADPATAAKEFGLSPTRIRAFREDPGLVEEFSRALGTTIEQAARQRAIEGVQEPLVSDGKIVLDDHGRPVAVRRYSDELLLALLRAQHPDRVDLHYPLSFRILASAFVLAFCIWAIGTILIAMTRQHLIGIP
jgi:hypothetical protein